MVSLLFSTSNHNKESSSTTSTVSSSQESKVPDLVRKKLELQLLRIPLLHLAKKNEYEEVKYVLSNRSIDVFDWLHGCQSSSSTGGNNNSNKSKNRKFNPSSSSNMYHFKGETILHLILQYDPPVDVIDMIISRYNECRTRRGGGDGGGGGVSVIDITIHADDTDDLDHLVEYSADVQGRTPLHTAVMLGCSLDTIKRLAQKSGSNSNEKTKYSSYTPSNSSTSPAAIQDCMLRYPLHWACTNPKRIEPSRNCLLLFSSSASSRQKPTVENPDLFQVVKTLLEAYPTAVIEIDADGYTPLDLAKQNGCKNNIIQLLERLYRTERASINRSDSADDDDDSYTRTNNNAKVSPKNGTAKNDTATNKNNKKESIQVQTIIIPNQRTSSGHGGDDDDDDDLSSVGSGGISKYRRPCKPIPSLQYIHEQFQI